MSNSNNHDRYYAYNIQNDTTSPTVRCLFVPASSGHRVRIFSHSLYAVLNNDRRRIAIARVVLRIRPVRSYRISGAENLREHYRTVPAGAWARVGRAPRVRDHTVRLKRTGKCFSLARDTLSRLIMRKWEAIRTYTLTQTHIIERGNGECTRTR